MIVTQTPLRVSFAGGGTDLAAYYERREGYVVSTAIDKFAYVIVKERFDDAIYLNYMRKEIVASLDEIQHELIREAFKIHQDDVGHIPLHQQALAWAHSDKVSLTQLPNNYMYFKWITLKSKPQ